MPFRQLPGPPTTITPTQIFIPSPSLMISCGTVPVDVQRRKIAILRDSAPDNITQLPKGRKNINESHHAAALRETYEETGIPFQPLPLRMATRATPTADMLRGMGLELDRAAGVTTAPGVDLLGVTDAIDNVEPSSVCIYRCRDTQAVKIVFWYASQGDSTAMPDKGVADPWEDHLHLEWVDAREAAGRMAFEADAQVIEKVLADMRNTGYDI